jgi:uroporphyrin-III C-methyltransferase
MANKIQISPRLKHVLLTLNTLITIGGAIMLTAVLIAFIWLTHHKPMLHNTPKLETQIANQQTLINKLQTELDDLRHIKIANNLNWELLEVTYLIKQADLALNTDGDIKKAMSLLSLAKEYTLNLDNTPLYHALEKDIATLQTVPIYDTENIVFRLAAINQQIMNLAPIPAKININNQTKQPTTNTTISIIYPKWKQMLHNAAMALKELVVIRHQNIEPLLEPQQLLTVRINIQSQILAAEWAVIHKDAKLYKNALEQAINWLQQYFALNTAATNNIIKNLTSLKVVDIAPVIPNINNSLNALHNLNHPINSTNPATNSKNNETHELIQPGTKLL